MFTLFFLGCFRGFISGQAKYQATEYIIDNPRIVALKANSIEMVGGEAVLFDALLIAPQGVETSNWRISACGLGNETETRIWDFACFEDQEAVSLLGQTDTLPFSIALPELPEIDCREKDPRYRDEDDFFEEPEECSHYLPIRFEALADDTPVYAAGFLNWYPRIEGTRKELAYDVPMEIIAPERARSGELIDLSFSFIPKLGSDNMEYSNFHWYIDAGELLQTGITAVTEMNPSSLEYPQGRVLSSNQLVIPEDYKGRLRIWVVVHQSWSEGLDMNWAAQEIIVE